jgi:hypothetical protein
MRARDRFLRIRMVPVELSATTKADRGWKSPEMSMKLFKIGAEQKIMSCFMVPSNK